MELTIEQALHQGVATHKEGKLEDAERLYRAILQSQPTHPDANHNLGLIAISVNKADAALLLFKTALEANPKIDQYWISYIDALIKGNQFANARQVLEQAKKQGVAGKKLNVLEEQLASINKQETDVSLSPSQEKLSNLLDYYQNGRLDEAEDLALSLTEEFSLHPFGWKVLGAVLKQTQKMSESLAASQMAVQLAPQDAAAHNNLGATLYELEKFSEAQASYTQAIALKPNFAAAHANLANTLMKMGRLIKAEVSCRLAIVSKPDFGEAYITLGNILKELGRSDEAEASYMQAIALKPEVAEAHNNLAILLRDLGRLEEAEANITQAIFLKSDFAQAYLNLGSLLKELGRLDEAEVSYLQAIKLIPNSAELLNDFGIFLQALGRSEEAEVCYRQALALKPDYAEAHNSLGVTLKELGRFEGAEASYSQSIALKPDYVEAHYNLGILWFEGQKYDLAAAKFELTDIKLSKYFAIQCSYLQEGEAKFFEKFDLLVNQGETNAVIGSLGFRSEFKYGIKKSNPFCNDPLKYVVKTDLNTMYDFKKIFIETARNILSDKSVSYRAQGHLTNGIQTAGNIFGQSIVQKSQIVSIIHAEIEKYRVQFKDSEEGFIKSWPTSYEIKGWLVCMQSGGKLDPHMHDCGWITGSIYINVPPKSKIDSGNLVLCLSDRDHVLGVDESHQSIIDVVTGSLCLFPSSLHHYTVPFEEKEDRVVLAFDVVPNN